ncbi:MAG: WD40 repeat protein [Myxococcota bacterium]|jgi:WD40 repeat protein
MIESTLFAREQKLRAAGLPSSADFLVCHRHAILAGGEAALTGKTALRWQTQAPLPAVAIWGHSGSIVDAVVVADRLVSLGADGAMRIWSADGRCQAEISIPGTALVAVAGGVLCARPDGSLEHRGLDGDLHHTLTGLPVGKIAGRGDGLIVLTSEAAICLDATGAEVSRHPLPGEDSTYTWRSDARLRRDGAVLIGTSEDYPGSLYGPQETWTLWDLSTNEQTRIPAPVEPPLILSGLHVHAMPDGHFRLQPPDIPPRPIPTHKGAVKVIGLTDRHLISGGEKLRFADATDGTERHRTVYQSGLHELAMGGAVVSINKRDSPYPPVAKVWDPETGACLHTVTGGAAVRSAITTSPDATRLAWTDKKVLYLADTSAPEDTRTVPRPWQWNRAIFWSVDGESVLIQTRGMALCVWDLDAEARRILTIKLLDSADLGLSSDDAVVLSSWSFYQFHALRLDGTSIGGLSKGLTTGTFTAGTGGRFGIAGGLSGGVVWMDLVAGHSKVILDKAGMISKTAADGDEAIWGGDEGLGMDGCVGLVSLPDGVVRWTWREGAVCAVDIGGPHVVAGERGGFLVVLSRTDGTILHRWKAHEGECCAVTICSDGAILSGGQDGLVRCWQPDGSGGEVLFEEGRPVFGLHIRGDRLLIDGAGPHRLRQRGTWAELPLPARMGRALLVEDGHRAVSLDPIWRLDRIDVQTAAVEALHDWGDWDGAADLASRPGGLFVLRSGTLSQHGGWSVSGDFKKLWHSGDPLVVSSPGALSAFSLDGEQLWRVALPGVVADLAVGAAHAVVVGEGFWILLKLSDGTVTDTWRTPNKWRKCALRNGRIAAGDEAGEVHLWSIEG